MVTLTASEDSLLTAFARERGMALATFLRVAALAFVAKGPRNAGSR